MVITHKGDVTTVYACNTCGTTMTIPPKYPLPSKNVSDR